MNHQSDKPVILQFLQIRTKAPILFWTIVFIVAAEAFVIGIAPLIVPDHFYLRAYLTDKAEEKIASFTRGDDRFLVFDQVVGWRNRPNTKLGNWAVDRYGSRSTHEFGHEKIRPTRVLFLGNSLMNGGAHLRIDETISAMIEDSLTEAINFGTMLYSVDQMYLDYVERLHRFNPDIVVVGLQSDPGDGLVNQFIPFWKRSETNMPFLKPRFVLEHDQLKLVEVPELEVYSNCLTQGSLFDHLETADSYYEDFDSYKRFGILPISSALWSLSERAENLSELLDEEPVYKDMVLAILNELRYETEKHGARLIVLTFADQQKAYPDRIRAMLPDQYGDLVAALRASGFEVVDSRSAIINSGLEPWQVYHIDERHFIREGNAVIAAALKTRVTQLLRTSAAVNSDEQGMMD